MAKFSVSKLHSQLFQFFPDLKPIKALDLRNFFTGLLDSYLPIFQYRIVKNNLGAEDEIAIGDANKISFLELQKNMGKLVGKPGPTYILTPEDHGKIFHNETGDLTVAFPNPNTLPIGFEFGAFTSAGNLRNLVIQIPVGIRIQNIRRTDGGIKNVAKQGLHFVYLKVVAAEEIAALSVSGAWSTYLDTLEDLELLYEGRKGGAPKYEQILYAGAHYYPTVDFTDSYQYFDKLKFIESEINFAISNDKLYWSGSVGRMFITNSHATDDITVELKDLRTHGIAEYYTIPAGQKMYFEALRIGKDTAYWIKAGASGSGSGGGNTEALNRTGSTIVLDVDAIYNDPDDPTEDATITISTVGSKNGVTGVLYWKGGSWPDFNIDDGKVVTKPFEFAAGAVHEIHYWFRKLAGKNRLTLIPDALNSPPIAQNVLLSGDAQVGKTLTINASYFDPDGDLESSRDYRFVFADDANGTNEGIIPNETGQSYIIQGAYIGKVIAPEVRMNAATGATPGEYVRGPWSEVITAASEIIKPDPADYTVTEVGSNAVILTFGLQTGDTMVRFGDNGDKISFDFNLASSGNHKFFARVRSGNTAEAQYENNYIIKIDGVVRPHTLNTQKGIVNSNDLGSSYFGWLEVTSLINLTAGNHTFEIEGGATYTMFDKIEIAPQP